MVAPAAPARKLRSCLRSSSGTRRAKGKGLRFIDVPETRSIPAVHIGLDTDAPGYKLRAYSMDNVQAEYGVKNPEGEPPRRPDLKLVAKRSMAALVIARARAIELASGRLNFSPGLPVMILMNRGPVLLGSTPMMIVALLYFGLRMATLRKWLIQASLTGTCCQNIMGSQTALRGRCS